MAGLAVPAAADDLSNQSFTIQYDAQGIRSLKRTSDVHDTDYIQAGGALGRLLIRFRTTANGDWRELREMTLVPQGTGADRVSYMLGTRQRTLAEKSTPSAAVGVAGLRGLNDGQVPAAAAGGGRGGGRGAGPGAAAANLPVFTWSGARGATQWVQYTLSGSRRDFARRGLLGQRRGSAAAPAATVAPRSWRVLYQDGNEWKPVDAKGPYGVEANTFSSVEFAPVRTMALRLEATMAKDATVGLAEWRVGARRADRRERRFERHPDVRARRRRARVDDRRSPTPGPRPVEIGDLAVPFNFAERTGARGDIYTRKLLRHSYVAGHGSWIYWQRSNGDGPYLVDDADGADEVRVPGQQRHRRRLRRLSRRTSTPRPRPRRRPPPADAGACR